MAKEKREQISGRIKAKTKSDYESGFKAAPRAKYITKNDWLDAVIAAGVKALGVILFSLACLFVWQIGNARGVEPQVGNVWKVTAYCPCKKCCGPRACGITADGHKAVGKFCAAPKSIPFKTMLDIPGYGVVPVWDRGGAIKENCIDVFYPTHKEALAWGVQYLKVERAK
jgi:3D (Asp-Asp-Asp) domain-containing protein